jgi:hemerythrin
MKIKTAVVPKHEKHVTWSDSYSMGIKVIDDQHKGLLNFVNDLLNHATGNEYEEREYFKSVIQEAVKYIKVHFETEEKLIMATKFPGYAEHKMIHDGFTRAVLKSVKDFESGKRLVLEKFAYFLKDWVLTHVAVEDVKYAEYFRKIATRKENGKLTISSANVG